jgi:hypothetical protein
MHLEAKQVLPDGHFWPKAGSGGQEATWITHLLPYMEQTGLYETIDWNTPFGCADGAVAYNTQASKTTLPMLVCPSNEQVDAIIANASGQKCYARGSYAANNGLGPMAETRIDPSTPKGIGDRSHEFPAGGPIVTGAQLAGVFYLNSRMTAADVSDGLSNTAFVSEVVAVAGEDFRGLLHYPEGCLYQHDSTPNSTMPDGIRSLYCVSVPQAPCTDAFATAFDRSLTMAARSQHPGGVHLLLGDGSVRFVADSIALNAWWALCTPKMIAGEAISVDY